MLPSSGNTAYIDETDNDNDEGDDGDNVNEVKRRSPTKSPVVVLPRVNTTQLKSKHNRSASLTLP
jgi:hypothetical protein